MSSKRNQLIEVMISFWKINYSFLIDLFDKKSYSSFIQEKYESMDWFIDNLNTIKKLNKRWNFYNLKKLFTILFVVWKQSMQSFIANNGLNRVLSLKTNA